MAGTEELLQLLSDGEWHGSVELRTLLGDAWQDVLAALRDSGTVVQAKRSGRTAGGRDSYSYRLCWRRPDRRES